MVFSQTPSPHVLPSLADVWEGSYWLDDEVEPEHDASRVVGNLTADLLIVGGGFTGYGGSGACHHASSHTR
jgi:hypothetical protein